MDSTTFAALVTACAPLVDPVTARAIVAVESGFNPHAIGAVGATLQRQPRSAAEALATATALRKTGHHFSVGLAQINDGNFERLGLTNATALDPCTNLAAMQRVLGECFARADSESPQKTLRRALSCYYSGNFTTGFRHGYVGRVVNAALAPQSARAPP